MLLPQTAKWETRCRIPHLARAYQCMVLVPVLPGLRAAGLRNSDSSAFMPLQGKHSTAILNSLYHNNETPHLAWYGGQQ